LCAVRLDINAVLLAVPDYDLYTRLLKEVDPLMSLARRCFVQAEGPSRRARNVARTVDSALFTAHAGRLTLDATVTRDAHGNAADDRWLLARDGACAGLNALVLCLYTGRADPWPETWYMRVVDKLRQKGLSVTVHRKYCDGSGCPVGPSVLKTLLATVSQMWLVSDRVRTLSDAHIDVIVQAWREGVGLYIAGDNDPYNADANPLLKALKLPTLSGNWDGRGILTEGGSHLLAHPVTTGIAAGLFEGVTVAHFDTAARPWPVPGKGIEVVDGEAVDDFGEVVGLSYKVLATTTDPVLPLRAGVIAHEGSRNKGRVIADGAFTRLYMDWDKHGTPQFLSSHADAPEPPSATTQFEYDKCFPGPCALTHESGQPFLVLFAKDDAAEDGGDGTYALVDDGSLNDPVAAGLKLGANVIGNEVMNGDALAAYVRENGCPFTRRRVLATLPLVSLENATNRRLLAHIITAAFMDGKFIRAAWLVFFGICIRAGAGAGAGAGLCHFQFLLSNMLEHVTMSPIFASVEPYVPLRQAIVAFAQPSASNPFPRVRKSIETIRALAAFVEDKGIAAGWERCRLLMQAVQRELVIANGTEVMDDYHRYMNRTLFDCNFGVVPVEGTGRLPGASDLNGICTLVARLALRGKTRSDTSCSFEAFMKKELDTSCSILSTAWTCAAPDTESFSAAIGLPTLLDREFARFHKASMLAIPPFATVLGPSVLGAPDGTRFYHGPLSRAMRHAAEIEEARKQYLARTFATSRADLCPSSYPLHLTVRRIMSRREFRGDLVFQQRHADAVAEELFRKAKNCNIYTQDFQDVVVECVRSFLDARAANALLATPLQEVSSRPRFQVLLQAELMVLGVVEDADDAADGRCRCRCGRCRCR
jgi:hypothetical protein